MMTHEEQVVLDLRERVEALKAASTLIRYLARTQPHGWIELIIRLTDVHTEGGRTP